jgi:hypothetical protein
MGRLRAVIALDDNQVGDRMRLPVLDVLLVFRRAIARECRVIVGKFDHVQNLVLDPADVSDWQTSRLLACSSIKAPRLRRAASRLWKFLMCAIPPRGSRPIRCSVFFPGSIPMVTTAVLDFNMAWCIE